MPTRQFIIEQKRPLDATPERALVMFREGKIKQVEIARLWGISPGRVSKLIAKALNKENEANLLGALLIDAGYSVALDKVRKLVRIDDFLPNYLDQLHRRIYQAILDSDGRTDQLTVANRMNDAGQLHPGDIAYMSGLIADFIDPLDCEHYARSVAENAARWRGGGRAKPKYIGAI